MTSSAIARTQVQARSMPAVCWFLVAVGGCCTPGPSEATPPSPTAAEPPVVPAARDVSETASDQVVTEQIRRRFREDFEVARVAVDVGITTVRGVVTLTGRVETDRQRAVMAAHARATEGVSRVDDQIVVLP